MQQTAPHRCINVEQKADIDVLPAHILNIFVILKVKETVFMWCKRANNS